MSALSELGFPEAILDFYADYSLPESMGDQICLLSIADIIEENRNLLPGYCVAPHGFYVFATTDYGDAYCFDANDLDKEGNPKIVLISHESVDEEINIKEILEIAKPVTKNLLEFLEKLIK